MSVNVAMSTSKLESKLESASLDNVLGSVNKKINSCRAFISSLNYLKSVFLTSRGIIFIHSSN